MAYGTVLLQLDAHREALAALWRENMSDARIADVVPQRIRWLYEQNPAGSALTWLGVADMGSIIGCGSIFPRRMVVYGNVVPCGVLADFAVTKSHRLAGAALAIQRAIAKESAPAGVELLYGYPNSKSDAIFKRLGYRSIGESSLWVKPLRSARKISERIANRALVGVASTVIDAGLIVADRGLSLVHGAARRIRSEHEACDIEEVTRADARFDGLWARAASEYSIVGERTAAYLNWRYTEFTTREHRFFCLVERRTRALRGYVAYAVDGEKGVVADLFCERLDVYGKRLLLALAQHLRRKGVASLSFAYLGPDAFGEHLESIGFVRRPALRSMVAYVEPDGCEFLKNNVFDKDAWFIADGELDI